MPRPKSPYKKRKGAKCVSKNEVRQIAKGAVVAVAEKKLMNTNDALTSINPTRPPGNNFISAVGFSTTTGESDVGAAITYGGTAVQDMFCLRPFLHTNGDPTKAAMALSGKYAQPVSCKSRWRITRDYARIDPIGATYANTPDAPPTTAECMPIVCRMIRCTPKMPAGTSAEVDPDTDLFVDEYSRSTGVGDLNFNEKEMLFYKTNKRRWNILEDKTFKILSPATVQYQLTPVASSGSTVSYYWSPLVQNTNSNCEKYLTTYHQLSHRKGGKVYYASQPGGSTNNSTTGQRREYVFFNFAWQGADAVTGEGNDRLQGPLGINIDCVNYTKFIDP